MSDNNSSVVDYYNSIADDYDNSRFNNSYGRFIDYEERKLLDRLIDCSEGNLRLEMACGTGRLTNYATHALDASEEMMKKARQLHQNVEFRLASATEMGYADAMFDTVYSFHLMMHLDLDTIGNIFSEVHRILKTDGQFIFDIPSKKRRKLLHHKQESWHGGTELSTDDVRKLCEGRFELVSRRGVMMLPVHKLPKSIRRPLQRTDYALANSFLREYSSYLVFQLRKL